MDRPIVFFDGRCPLCHRAVLALLELDSKRVLRFAPLQGETAAEYLSDDSRRELSTLVYRSVDGEIATKSTGFLRAAEHLSEVHARSARLLLVIPNAIRDGIYDIIADNRYNWFGQYDACRLPDGSDERFLP